jgi:hypothetical protein
MMLKNLVKMLSMLCAELWKNTLQILDLFFPAPQWDELFPQSGVVVC